MYNEHVLNKDYFLRVITDLAAMVEEQRDYLTQLDADIGDSDHGINLTIGFRAVMKKLPEWEEENLTSLFKKVGMVLLGKVGGASGPLYGGLFMKFGEPANNQDEVTFDVLLPMFTKGVELVQSRGKASVGDKTMLDALVPAVEALREAIEQEEEPIQAFEKCVEAAKVGRDATIPLIAKKGRAMRLGERAIGHLDPGATSSHLILSVFLENLKSEF